MAYATFEPSFENLFLPVVVPSLRKVIGMKIFLASSVFSIHYRLILQSIILRVVGKFPSLEEFYFS
jgi:hypothetical protein